MAGPAKQIYRNAPFGMYQKDVELFYCVEVVLGDDTLRVWSGLGDLDIDVNSLDKYFNGFDSDNSRTDDPVEIDDNQLIWFKDPTGGFTYASETTYNAWQSGGFNGIYLGVCGVSGGLPDWSNEITEGITRVQGEGLYFDVSQVTSLPTDIMFVLDTASSYTSIENEIPMEVATTSSTVTFIGAGSLVSISDVEDSLELKYPSLSVTLSGLPADVLSNDIYGAAIDGDYQGEDVNIYIGAVDSSGKPSVMPLYKGMIDVLTIDNTGDSISVTATIQNKLNTLMRPRAIRYTEQRQLDDFAGDTSLRHVTDLQDIQIEWG